MVSIESIWSYPVVLSEPSVLSVAFHVNSKSFEVIGEPSSQTASGLILNVIVNGSWVMPPLSSVGSSASSAVTL